MAEDEELSEQVSLLRCFSSLLQNANSCRCFVPGYVLAEVLTARFRYILDASFNSDDSDALSMTEKLDFLERRLYEEVRMFHFNPKITFFIYFNFSGPEEPAPAPPLVPAADRPPTRLRHGAEAQEEEGGRSMNN